MTAFRDLTEPGTIPLPLSSITVDADSGPDHLATAQFFPVTADIPIFIVRAPTVDPFLGASTEVGFFVPTSLGGGDYQFLLGFKSSSPGVAAYDLKSEVANSLGAAFAPLHDAGIFNCARYRPHGGHCIVL